MVESPAITVSSPVQNQPPWITDIQISPREPGPTDRLKVTYAFNDSDGDLEGATQIRWYRNLALQATYNDLTVIPADQTSAGEVWYARVTLHDGQDYGQLIAARSVEIAASTGNLPPIASDVYLTPAYPGPNDNLRVHYVYDDPEDDSQGATRFHWRADGVLQTALTDITIIPASAITVGQTWCVGVEPHDGQDYGEIVASRNCVTVGSDNQVSGPTLVTGSLYIAPAHPVSGEYLQLHYHYQPTNNLPEADSLITWYRDGQPQPTYANLTLIPPRATAPGQNWFATMQPFDGLAYGQVYTSLVITINRPPTASNLHIAPNRPNNLQTISLDYQFHDLDDDPNGPPRIRWYRNELITTPTTFTHVAAYDDRDYLPVGAVDVGERWRVTVQPFDGLEYGAVITSNPVQIEQTGPVVLYLPLVLKNWTGATPPPPICDPANHYEENDERAQADVCPPLPFNQTTASLYPDDVDDLYHFVLTQTSRLNVIMTNYQAEGQLLLYYQPPDGGALNLSIARDYAKNPPQAQTLFLPRFGEDPTLLTDLEPGRYYLRVYSTDYHSETAGYEIIVVK